MPSAKVLRAGAHGLINPILDVESSVEFVELRTFKYKLDALINKRKGTTSVRDVAVYFRDLDNGPVIGIHDTEKFAPSSLLKTPMMIAALRRAAREPGFLDLRLKYQGQSIVDATTPEKLLEDGREYSIDELLRAMIASSDNGAAVMIRRAVGPEELDQVYRDLGILIPKVRGPGDSMQVREYATFFRILYNAAYLDKAQSQKALEYLASTAYNDGLVAGVPPGMTVAHKYGERSFPDSPLRQLHDCGIVYYKPEPYILCVMTRGQNVAELTAVIRDVSRLVYAEVSSQITKP